MQFNKFIQASQTPIQTLNSPSAISSSVNAVDFLIFTKDNLGVDFASKRNVIAAQRKSSNKTRVSHGLEICIFFHFLIIVLHIALWEEHLIRFNLNFTH